MGSLIEYAVVLLMVAAALAIAGRRTRRLRWGRDQWNQLARQTAPSMLLVFCLAFSVLLLAAALGGVPAPAIHDEFCYLLQADTFSRARLTNPTHPLADLLETPHVIQHPSYQAKYPPGQGFLLAAGQVLLGLPIVGVWLTQAAACAAIYWALRGWAPARWALLGGLIAAGSHAMISLWGMSYWGGSLALLGGALAFGAVPRIATQPDWRHGLILGVGIALWTVSRPYEGLLACIPIGIELVRIFLHAKPERQGTIVVQVLGPMLAIVALALVGNGFYNWAVTGNPLKMPYAVWHDQTAGGLGMHSMILGDARAGVGNWLSAFDLSEHRSLLAKIIRQFGFYATPALIPALLAAASLWRCRKTRFAAIALLFVLAGVLAQATPSFPHYAAPVGVLFFALVIQGFRRLRVWRFRERRVGNLLSQALPWAYAVGLALALFVDWPAHPYPPGHGWSLKRAELVELLEATPGRHLVLVRYDDNHVNHFEWAYNNAQPDDAKIVWVRDRDGDAQARILNHFIDRRVWRLNADEESPMLMSAESVASVE